MKHNGKTSKSKGRKDADGGKKNGDTLPARFRPAFWEDADSRFALVRAVRNRVEELKADIGADSKQKEILAERAGFLAILLESQETKAVKSGKFDGGSYTQQANALLGLLRALGLEKHAKQAEDLQSYIARKKRKARKREAKA